MENSLHLARIAGPVMLVVGLGLIANRRSFPKMIEDFFANAGLLYISGFFTLILGLLMIQYHNVWQLHWRVFLTVLGWIACAKGAAIVVFPDILRKTARIFDSPGVYMAAGIFYMAAGGFFCAVGYFPSAI